MLNDFAGAILAVTPDVEAAKAGTEHEGHDGWAMRHDGPGRLQCSCGETLDGVLGLPPRRRFWMAVCTACRIPVPFGSEQERDEWADAHEAAEHLLAGHQVRRYEEDR